MAAVVFIGDEVTAQGFRLAGAEAKVPAADEVVASFADALREAQLVLITAEAAARIDPGELDRAIRNASPLVLVVPDAARRVLPDDAAETVERALGIAP